MKKLIENHLKITAKVFPKWKLVLNVAVGVPDVDRGSETPWIILAVYMGINKKDLTYQLYARYFTLFNDKTYL